MQLRKFWSWIWLRYWHGSTELARLDAQILARIDEIKENKIKELSNIMAKTLAVCSFAAEESAVRKSKI